MNNSLISLRFFKRLYYEKTLPFCKPNQWGFFSPSIWFYAFPKNIKMDFIYIHHWCIFKSLHVWIAFLMYFLNNRHASCHWRTNQPVILYSKKTKQYKYIVHKSISQCQHWLKWNLYVDVYQTSSFKDMNPVTAIIDNLRAVFDYDAHWRSN